MSDTNYGWGPNAIGDCTDIPNWSEWFASDNSATYLYPLFTEGGQNASYSRNLADPGGENEIIMFKSSSPNSALEGNPADSPDPEGWLSVGHAKNVYKQILRTSDDHPEKLFVVITAPPLSDSTFARNARAFKEWLLKDWLQENTHTQGNVVIFLFFQCAYKSRFASSFHHPDETPWVGIIFCGGAGAMPLVLMGGVCLNRRLRKPS